MEDLKLSEPILPVQQPVESTNTNAAALLELASCVKDLSNGINQLIHVQAQYQAAVSSAITATATNIDRLTVALNYFVEVQTTPVYNAHIGETSEPDGQEKAIRTSHSRTTAEETLQRINRAIDAIMLFNNMPERAFEAKWAIGINTLKAFAGSQEAIVATIGGRNRNGELVIGTRQAEIEQHHAQHCINPNKHNYRHRSKTPIDQLILLE